MLFASFMMLAVGTGSVFALAVSLKDIAATLGWPRTIQSFGYSLQFFGTSGMAIGSAIGGGVFDLTGGYTLPFAIGVAFNIDNLAIIGSLLFRIRRSRPAIAASTLPG